MAVVVVVVVVVVVFVVVVTVVVAAAAADIIITVITVMVVLVAKVAHRLHMAKVTNYLLADRDTEPYYVAVHIPGSKVGKQTFYHYCQY